jgi:UPF0755 protein
MINEPSQPEVTPVLALPPKKSSLIMKLFSLLICAGVVAFSLLYLYNQPPSNFSKPTSVTVEAGMTAKSITQSLEEANVVRSKHLLYFALTLLHDPTDIKASVFVFDEPLSTLEIAKRLVDGDFDSDLVRFTHFEGERATHVANRASEVLANFDKEAFLALAVPLEGKLYPDTYFVPADFTAQQLVDLMVQTFNEETGPLQEKMSQSILSETEILTLASILEREANSPESMQIVSGILQGRMEAGMPLQADASVEYILDKPLKELTPEDLKVDSPYNTYLNRGLPPTPIGNPGIDAIMAVLEPTQSEYVFYITDNDGVFHYAKTYDEHLDNIERYLR